MEENKRNRLVLVGNGFDLAHGLKTSYKDFLDWHMCTSFKNYHDTGNCNDGLIEIRNRAAGMKPKYLQMPNSLEEVLQFIQPHRYNEIVYTSNFFKRLIDSYQKRNWIDIERYYFGMLKAFFRNSSSLDQEKISQVSKLNSDFNIIINHLVNYIQVVNNSLPEVEKIDAGDPKCNIHKAFINEDSELRFLNFNYTDTLFVKNYAKKEQVIHIHGRVADLKDNPIIFGYGDESDPVYQTIEDTGENIYLEHIKSFGYLQANNYHQLLLYIDSAPFVVYILGHSCGLSDRILLNEIFEHDNCKEIEIFFHQKADGTDNFKEITQEISRHFRSKNKNMMRRKIKNKDFRNIIPQQVSSSN